MEEIEDIRGKCWMYNSWKELERNKEERKSLDRHRDVSFG